jgi:hypothetical protein
MACRSESPTSRADRRDDGTDRVRLAVSAGDYELAPVPCHDAHNAAYEPKRMLDHMDRIHNIHGKFYEMTEDLVEPSIPYDEIVAVLKKGGYDGYICSEYEGNRWIEDAHEVDSVEQVRRQQAMLKNLIEAPQAGA